MQHVFEFMAIGKLSEEDNNYNLSPEHTDKKTPTIIHRYFNTQSSRKRKVTDEIYKALKKEPFNVSNPEADLESFLIRQLR